MHTDINNYTYMLTIICWIRWNCCFISQKDQILKICMIHSNIYLTWNVINLNKHLLYKVATILKRKSRTGQSWELLCQLVIIFIICQYKLVHATSLQMVHKMSRASSNSSPLQWLCPMPSTLFPQISTWLSDYQSPSFICSNKVRVRRIYRFQDQSNKGMLAW